MLDVNTVDIPSLVIVAVVQPELLVGGVRFTLSDLPPLIVAPREGVFVLGPLGSTPFSITDLLSNGTFEVTAVALDNMDNDVGNTFSASVTVSGLDTNEPTPAPVITTMQPTEGETNPPTSFPTTDIPTMMPIIVTEMPAVSLPTLLPTSVQTAQPATTPTTVPPTGTLPFGSSSSSCMLYPSCPQVSGDCCPNIFGGFYSCCLEGMAPMLGE